MAGNATGGLCTLRRPDGVGSEVAPGSTTASGYCLRIACTSGSADSRMEKMCSGPGEEVVDRLVLDGDRRILKAQKVLEGGLERAGEQALRVTVPVHRGDHEPVAQVEVGLPVDGVVLVAPRHVPDRGARHGGRPVAVLGGAQAVVGVVPLDEQRQRLAEFLGDLRAGSCTSTSRCSRRRCAGAASLLRSFVGQWVLGEVVVVLGVRRVGPHEVRRGRRPRPSTCRCERLLQVEHLAADQRRRLGERGSAPAPAGSSRARCGCRRP